jgi:hypothetical protein
VTYTGKVQNGVILLDDCPDLPEGAIVRVEVVQATSVSESAPTLVELLMPIVGVVDDLPPDMAANHDHYLHRSPKR